MIKEKTLAQNLYPISGDTCWYNPIWEKKEKILGTKRFSAYLNYFKLMKKKKREKRIFHLKRDFLEINCFVKLSLLKNFVTYTGCVYY